MSDNRNRFFYITATLVNVATPVVTFPYLTRILGAPGVGAVNFVGSFLQNFVIVSALGLGVYGVREVSRFKDDPVARVSLFFELCVLQGVMSLLLAAAYFLCVWRLDAFAGMRWVSAIYGITLVLAPLSFEWFFIGMKDFSYVSIRNIIFRLASIPLVFIFVKDAGDSSSYLLIMFLISTGSAILNLIHFRRHYFVRFSFAKLQYAGHFRPLVILGVYNVLTNVYLSLPLTFLGFLSGHMEVGYYYAANRIVQVAITVMAGMNLVLVPSANLAHSEGDLTSLGKIVSGAQGSVVTFALPVAAFLIANSKELITVLAGEGYHASIELLVILAPAILFVAYAQVFVSLIISVWRKDGVLLTVSGLGMALSVSVNLFFIPRYGAVAAAYSYLASEILVTLVIFFISARLLRLKLFDHYLLANLAVSLGFFCLHWAAAKLLYTEGLRLVVLIFSTGLFYVLMQVYVLRSPFMAPAGRVMERITKLNLIK